MLEADLSYEIDVWGRIRNSVASARATEQATAADLATLDLSTHAELATDYFTLCGQDTQVALLDQTVADYARAVALTRSLFEGGAAARGDLDQAEAQLETARTQARDMRLRRAQTEHAIAVLVGESPSTFHLDSRQLRPDAVPPAVDPGLPSALLERRPDVAARSAGLPPRTPISASRGRPIFRSSAWEAREDSRARGRAIGSMRRAASGPSVLPRC